jgi:hypothetical protein
MLEEIKLAAQVSTTVAATVKRLKIGGRNINKFEVKSQYIEFQNKIYTKDICQAVVDSVSTTLVRSFTGVLLLLLIS